MALSSGRVMEQPRPFGAKSSSTSPCRSAATARSSSTRPNPVRASIRTPEHVRQSALAGADCATLPPKIFAALYKHELTDSGVEAFLKDWASTGQSIL